MFGSKAPTPQVVLPTPTSPGQCWLECGRPRRVGVTSDWKGSMKLSGSNPWDLYHDAFFFPVIKLLKTTNQQIHECNAFCSQEFLFQLKFPSLHDVLKSTIFRSSIRPGGRPWVGPRGKAMRPRWRRGEWWLPILLSVIKRTGFLQHFKCWHFSKTCMFSMNVFRCCNLWCKKKSQLLHAPSTLHACECATAQNTWWLPSKWMDKPRK